MSVDKAWLGSVTVGFLALVAAGCSGDVTPAVEPPIGVTAAALDHGAAAKEMAQPSGHGDLASAALRAGAIHAMQRDAGVAHRVRVEAQQGGKARLARAAASGFEVRFRASGVGLQREGHGDEVGTFALSHIGCPGALEPVGAAEPQADGNRVEYPRSAGSARAREWYLAGPLGLEQGFLVEQAPACLRRSGELVVAIDLGGLRPELEPGGTAIVLRQRGNQPGRPADGVAFRYGELFAQDAGGRELPATLAVAEHRVELHIQAAGASLPIAIDPLFSVLDTELFASDAHFSDDFGYAVAIDGDTAIVGAVGAKARAGRAYVFVRTGSGWTEQQELAPSLSGANSLFGTSVAIDGDTAIVGKIRTFSYDTGTAIVFVRSGTTWTEQQILHASDETQTDDQFGCSVAVAGDTALVGSWRDDNSAGFSAGSAYEAMSERNVAYHCSPVSLANHFPL